MATASPSTPKNILLVTREETEVVKYWPVELRALFDPRADYELAEQIEAEKRATGDAESLGDDLPF